MDWMCFGSFTLVMTLLLLRQWDQNHSFVVFPLLHVAIKFVVPLLIFSWYLSDFTRHPYDEYLVLDEMTLLWGWFILWVYHKWHQGNQLNCREVISYMRASSSLRFFYSFFMLHNPRVSPCTQYHRFVHLCDLSPQYTKSSYLKTQHYQLAQLDLGRSISNVNL